MFKSPCVFLVLNHILEWRQKGAYDIEFSNSCHLLATGPHKLN